MEDKTGGQMKKSECKWCGGLSYNLVKLHREVDDVNSDFIVCGYCMGSTMVCETFYTRPSSERYKIEMHINRCFNILETMLEE